MTIPALRHSEKRGADLLSYGAGYASPHGSSAVRTVQLRLSGLGYRVGQIDGRFGPRTERAVRRFQAANGLAVDGVVGPETRAALASPSPLLKSGVGVRQRGGSPLVREVQRWLRRMDDGPGPIDGRYGPLTARAVRLFQRDHGLVVDGVVGIRTWHALLKSVRGHRGLARRHVPAHRHAQGRKPAAQHRAHKAAPGAIPAPARSPKRRAIPATRGHFPVAILGLLIALLVLAVGFSSYIWTRRRARRDQVPVMLEPRRVRREVPRSGPTIQRIAPRSRPATWNVAPRSGPVAPGTGPRPAVPQRDEPSEDRDEQPVPEGGRRR